MTKELRFLLEGHWRALDSEGAERLWPWPGVYIISCPQDGRDLEGKAIDLWDVMYVGQSMNVADRLGKFKRSAKDGRKGHCAGRRLFGEARFAVKTPIYFNAWTCPPKNNSYVERLRNIGDVIRLENYAIAYIAQHADIPWLNKSVGGKLETFFQNEGIQIENKNV